MNPRPDSVRQQPRTITVRFLRDRLAELRPDFGGYRIYRGTGSPDTAHLVLVRRYSQQTGDAMTWNFSRLNTDTSSVNYLQYMCNGAVAHDSILTFVDPDSSGSYQKVCRRVDHLGRCLSIGDSVFKLVAPPGPHDGFQTWYTVTYEGKNLGDNNYEDLFVPDSSNGYAACDTVGSPNTCPNLNNKAANLIASSLEPTSGPTTDLQRVAVVPNPFRAAEAWDSPGGHEVHFTHLPAMATIKIYTVSGELVAQLEHRDNVRDFERWNLKNQDGHDVASGIYMYRVEAGTFTFQHRFVVVR
jgi:hypothetical protein